MPTPDSFQPSLAPAEPSHLGIRRFLHSVLGLIGACAFVLMLWPGLLEVAFPGTRLERFGGSAPIRFAAFFVFIFTLTIRLRVSPRKQPGRTAIAWAAFANSVGGTLLEEHRDFSSMRFRGPFSRPRSLRVRSGPSFSRG